MKTNSKQTVFFLYLRSVLTFSALAWTLFELFNYLSTKEPFNWWSIGTFLALIIFNVIYAFVYAYKMRNKSKKENIKKENSKTENESSFPKKVSMFDKRMEKMREQRNSL